VATTIKINQQTKNWSLRHAKECEDVFPLIRPRPPLQQKRMRFHALHVDE